MILLWKKLREGKLYPAVLIVICGLGLALRLANQYSYLIYPDAYQNILVAKNIRDFGGVIGTLGEGGLLYPPFFSWSRVGYSLLLNLFGLGNVDDFLVIKSVSLFTGIASVAISYLLGKEFWGSKKSGLLSALLMATSFNHVTWSGFALTESTAIFFQLLFLWLLVMKVKFRNSIIDIIAGESLAMAIFTRYEYVFLLVPTIILLISRKELRRIKGILVGLIGVGALILFNFYPVKETGIAAWREVFGVNLSARIGTIITLVVLGGLFFLYQFQTRISSKLLEIGKRLLFLSGCCLIGVFVLFGTVNRIAGINLFGINLGGLTGFIYTDFMLIIVLVISCWRGIKKNQDLGKWIFLLIGIIGLGSIYAKLNPEMQRYGTHLIPLMVMAASYLGANLNRIHYERVLIVLFGILLFSQILITNKGVKEWEAGVWTKEAYEQEAAKGTGKYLSKNTVLIVAFPETYYFYTNNTTLSQTNFFSSDSLMGLEDDRPVAIVSDMGTRVMFPDFFAFLHHNMEDFRRGEFYTFRDFYMGGTRIKEEGPVEVYITNIAILRQKLSR